MNSVINELYDDFTTTSPLELSQIWHGSEQHVLYEAWRAPAVRGNSDMNAYGKSLVENSAFCIKHGEHQKLGVIQV